VDKMIDASWYNFLRHVSSIRDIYLVENNTIQPTGGTRREKVVELSKQRGAATAEHRNGLRSDGGSEGTAHILREFLWTKRSGRQLCTSVLASISRGRGSIGEVLVPVWRGLDKLHRQNEGPEPDGGVMPLDSANRVRKGAPARTHLAWYITPQGRA
jgi:hypothetical protein